MQENESQQMKAINSKTLKIVKYSRANAVVWKASVQQQLGKIQAFHLMTLTYKMRSVSPEETWTRKSPFSRVIDNSETNDSEESGSSGFMHRYPQSTPSVLVPASNNQEQSRLLGAQNEQLKLELLKIENQELKQRVAKKQKESALKKARAKHSLRPSPAELVKVKDPSALKKKRAKGIQPSPPTVNPSTVIPTPRSFQRRKTPASSSSRPSITASQSRTYRLERSLESSKSNLSSPLTLQFSPTVEHVAALKKSTRPPPTPISFQIKEKVGKEEIMTLQDYSRAMLLHGMQDRRVFFAVMQNGELCQESAVDELRREKLWDAMTTSLDPHFSHVWTDPKMAKGDVQSLWYAVTLLGLDSITDARLHWKRVRAIHTKTHKEGFVSWFTHLQNIWQELSQLGVHDGDEDKRIEILFLLNSDPRYHADIQHVKDWEKPLAQALARFTQTAESIGDNTTVKHDMSLPTARVIAGSDSVHAYTASDDTNVCREWGKSGTCPKRDTCPWSHLDKNKSVSQEGRGGRGRGARSRGRGRGGRGGGRGRGRGGRGGSGQVAVQQVDGQAANASANNPTNKDRKLICFQFTETGQCGYGDKCRFSHDEKSEKVNALHTRTHLVKTQHARPETGVEESSRVAPKKDGSVVKLVNDTHTTTKTLVSSVAQSAVDSAGNLIKVKDVVQFEIGIQGANSSREVGKYTGEIVDISPGNATFKHILRLKPLQTPKNHIERGKFSRVGRHGLGCSLVTLVAKSEAQHKLLTTKKEHINVLSLNGDLSLMDTGATITFTDELELLDPDLVKSCAISVDGIGGTVIATKKGVIYLSSNRTSTERLTTNAYYCESANGTFISFPDLVIENDGLQLLAGRKEAQLLLHGEPFLDLCVVPYPDNDKPMYWVPRQYLN